MELSNSQSLVRALMDMSPHAHALLDRRSDSLLIWNESFASLCRIAPHQGTTFASLGFPREIGTLISAQTEAVMSGREVCSLPQPHFRLKTPAGSGLYAARLAYVSNDGRRVMLSLQCSGAWDMLGRLFKDGSMYDFFPDIVAVHDLAGRVLACNQAGCAFVHKSRDEILGRDFDDILDKDAAAVARDLFYRCVSTGNPQAANLSFVHNGQRKTLIATMDPIHNDAGTLLGALVVAYDDTQRQLMDETLQRRTNLLQAAGRAAQKLLANNIDFDRNVNEVLAILGEATGVDRVYVWNFHPGEDQSQGPGLLASQLYEWSPQAEPQQNSALCTNRPVSIMPHWMDAFQAGKCVNGLVKDMQGPEKDQLEPQGIVSILCAPILIQGDLWGFVGFDDCSSEYIWTESEENILRAAGTVIGTAIYNRRVDEALRESEDRFRMVADATGEIIWSMNADRVIDYVSDKVTPVLGYKPGELLGRDLASMLADSGYLAECATPQNSIARDVEAPVRCKDGSVRWLRTSCKVIFDENGVMRKGFATSQDITPMRLATEEARKAGRAKDEFLANISHEIRTPLNAVTGLTRLLLRTDLESQQRDWLEKLDFAGKSLLRIVDGILDFAKMEAGDLEMSAAPFCVREVLEAVGAPAAEQAAAKGLGLDVEISPDISGRFLGDAVRLGQVIAHLLDNAVKFTATGGITLTAKLNRCCGGLATLHFSVKDTGIGLSAEQRNELFQAFSQADSSATRRYGGMGLGLAFCQKLVNLMDGEIWCESEPGRGSTFHFTVSLVPLDLGRVCEHVPQTYSALRVLLASPHAAERAELRDLLLSLGCSSIDEADSAASALPKMCPSYPGGPSSCNYDLLLAGSHMTDFQAIEHTRLHCGRTTGRLDLGACSVEVLRVMEDDQCLATPSQAGIREAVGHVLCRPLTRSGLFDAINNIYGRNLALSGNGGAQSQELGLAASVAGRRILVVEDNEINQLVAREMLANAGLEVTLAENGVEALRLLDEQPFDLVLMDIQMPEMDGLTATARLRGDPRFADLPIIAMTAHAMNGDVQKSLAAGMNAHLTKPIDSLELLRTLARWLPGSPRGEAA